MQVVDGTILVALGQRRCTIIEILRETPSFRAGRKGGGPTGATAEPSGGVEAPAFRPGRTSTNRRQNNSIGTYQVVSLNCRDEFPQTVDKDAPERAMYPGNEAERDRTTFRSSSRHDLSVWPPSLA